MLTTCPYCGNHVPSHGICCRVPEDLDRFERVFQRLAAAHDNPGLQDNLLRYLVAYGRRPDDGEDQMAVQPPLGGANSATSGAW